MEEKTLDRAPIWDDLSTFDGRPWRGRVDLVTGGYPCQPFSLAGARRGAADPRHLWPHVRRIVEEVRPPLCFFENVPGHVSLGLETVVSDLEGMGYRVAALLLGAADLGAPHRRERLWIMAYRESERRDEAPLGSQRESLVEESELGHSISAGLAVGESRPVAAAFPAPWPPGPADVERWALVEEAAQPSIRRVADELRTWVDDSRSDRLRALGNAVVPTCANAALRILLGQLFHD